MCAYRDTAADLPLFSLPALANSETGVASASLVLGTIFATGMPFWGILNRLAAFDAAEQRGELMRRFKCPDPFHSNALSMKA